MTIRLRTPSLEGTEYDFDVDLPNQQIVITSAKCTEFRYQLRAIRDLYQWLKITNNGCWVFLGTKNQTETANPGSVEEWARSSLNPVGGFYGITNGFRGRFASFIPPILESMGLAEVEHNVNNNRMRSL